MNYTTDWGFTYDHIFYIPIEFPMECDGVRSESSDYQKTIDERIKALLEQFVGPERKTEITGT